MKTIKKLFLPTFLFVALLVSSSIVLVSCSDEYDDTELTAEVTDIQSQLTTNVSELETKLAALESIQSSLPTMDELKAVADEATKYADEDKAIAIAEAYESDATLLTNINTKIDALEVTLTEAIDSKVNSDDVNAAITSALNDINLADIRTLFDSMDNADLIAMKAFVDDWDTITLPAIIAQITSLGVTVKEMITSIDVVKTENYWYWGKVKNDGTFGPNDEIEFKAGQELDTLSMNLIANINPSNADISRYNFSIKNSQGTELPVINIGTPSEYTSILTKSNNFNNIWTIPTTLDWTELSNLTGYSSDYSSTPSLYNNYMKSDDDTVRLALTATIKDEYATTDEDKREITSPYDITFKRTEQPALSGLTVAIIYREVSSSINRSIKLSLEDANGDPLNTFVYKKYITVNDSSLENSFYYLNKLYNLNDPITLICNNKSCFSSDIDFTVHYLNFDGTTGTANITTNFN